MQGARLLQGVQNSYLFYPDRKDFIISNGRFAVIHPAIMLPSKKKVICKQLQPAWVNDKENRMRFLLEASVNISNSGVVHNLDFISEPDGLFLIQEFVEGINFHQYLSGLRISKQAREKEVIKLIISVIDSLIPVHQAGYFHCGLKPSSIIVEPATGSNDEFPLTTIIDFALCQKKDLIPESTSKGRITYNIRYSAPELLLNQWHLVNDSTDLFSLGIMLYEYIAGIAPHKATNPIVLVQMQVSTPLPSHDYISESVMNVIRKACEKPAFRKPPGNYTTTETQQLILDSMEYRYQNCTQMAVDLIKLL